MRKFFLASMLLIGLVFLGAAPVLAESYAPSLLIEWGETYSAFGDQQGECVGTMIRLSGQGDLGVLYLDTGLDYDYDQVIFDLGLTVRSPRAIFIFRPYGGWGLAYNLTEWSPVWRVSPYMVFGSEFLWMFWEEEVTLYGLDPGVITRAGVRVRF
ncbi:MAG: hypothetical protein ACM3ZC_09060 [Bacteroidota bacterium]